MENLRFELMFDCLRGNEGGGGGRKRYVKWSELFVWCCVIFKEPLRKEYNAVHSRVDILPSFP